MPNVEDNAQTETIRWKEWSAAVFEEARTSNKLVLLDLFAPWCHWCHVMDETTYSDPKVIRAVVDNFVPVRVDIDQRPDITDRYNWFVAPTLLGADARPALGDLGVRHLAQAPELGSPRLRRLGRDWLLEGRVRCAWEAT